MTSDNDELARLIHRSSRGSLAAKLELACCFLTGQAPDGGPLPVDVAKARDLLRECHEAGALSATVELAMSYQRDAATEDELRLSKALFENAADRGSFVACIELARIFRFGRREPACARTAAMWYRRALDVSEDIDLAGDVAEARAFLSA